MDQEFTGQRGQDGPPGVDGGSAGVSSGVPTQGDGRPAAAADPGAAAMEEEVATGSEGTTAQHHPPPDNSGLSRPPKRRRSEEPPPVAGAAAASAAAPAPKPPMQPTHPNQRVMPNVQLVERLRQTPEELPKSEARAIEQEAIEHLAAIDPFLRHLISFKLVRNQRKNFINFRIKKALIPTIHFHRDVATGCVVLFSLSIFLEPYIVVTPVHPRTGAPLTWADADPAVLNRGIASFKHRHQLKNERYRYLESGVEAESFPAAVHKGKAHLGGTAPFCLAILVATNMYRSHIPALRAMDEQIVRAGMAITKTWSPREVLGGLIEKDVWFKHFMQRSREGPYPELWSDHLSSVYCAFKKGSCFEIHLSDKFEPFAIALVMHPIQGKVHRLDHTQIEGLREAVDDFTAKFGNTGFHYTSYAERMETEHFVKGGGASQKSKAHSAHFHLKIRITKKVYITRMPIFSALKYDEIESRVEPVQYNANRDTVTWEDVLAVLKTEADDLEKSQRRT